MLPTGSMTGPPSSPSHWVRAHLLCCGDGCSHLPSQKPLSIGIQWLSLLVLIPSLLSNLLFMIWFPSEPGRCYFPDANTCVFVLIFKNIILSRALSTAVTDSVASFCCLPCLPCFTITLPCGCSFDIPPIN